MAACDALYHDPHQPSRPAARSGAGRWPEGWLPCPRHANRTVTIAGHPHRVCGEHHRQLTALAAAGLATQARWHHHP